MARQYSRGGRQRPGAFGLPPQASMPIAKRSLKERVGALKNLRPFIAMVWHTSPHLTAASLSLRLVRALLPIITLFIGKLIIDDVVQLVQMPDRPQSPQQWLDSGRLNWLGLLLIIEFVLAVLADVLGRVVSLIDSLLSERVSNDSSVRLMEHAATLDLEDFEDADFQDQLERARRQTSGRMTLMGQLFRPGAGHRDGRQALRPGSSSTRRGSSCCCSSPWCRRFSAKRISMRKATRSITSHARAARTRLYPADRCQRRDRQGSEDFRPQQLPDRPLPATRDRDLRGEPQARDASRRLGRVFTALGTIGYYLAYAYIAWRTLQANSRSVI